MAASSKFDLNSLLQCIKCDNCDKPNPTKRCSQCHGSFYCSIDCQKEDWTKNSHKTFCTNRQSAMLKLEEKKNTALQVVEYPEALNASCAICLEEPIVNAVVLKGCRHAFCSTCLMEWQKYQQNMVMPSFSESCSCPVCRQSLPATIAEEALEKAKLYIAAGSLVTVPYDEANDPIILKISGDTLCPAGSSLPKEFPRFKDERQRRLYQLALDQLDRIIQNNPYDLQAIFVKGAALRYIHPEEAIKSLRMALKIDEKGTENKKKLDALEEEMMDPYNATQEERTRILEAYNELTQSKDFHISQMGSGPFRLLPIMVLVAESYESAGKYNKAASIYEAILHRVVTSNPRDIAKIDKTLKLSISAGASRCFYLDKNYHLAIFQCRLVLDINRRFPGNHLVLAQSQWALGDKQGALTTLKRGILYEVPDSVENRQRNIACLKRLSSFYSDCDEAAVTGEK